MPILILGLVAFAIFVVMGLMLFSATIIENRDRNKRVATAKASVEAPATKTRSANA